MSRIIGTAGHIDHGKTSLVRALTGQDTDRLPEEKARGISIELGFASLQLADGTRAGVVDVPGHERFIRTMLAGAHGMDLVLFTVAADDGVMPQTVEHLDIVRLLDVLQAVFVITKADLVGPSRVTAVASEVRALSAPTRFAGAPILPVSTLTGQGVQDLRVLIEKILGRAPGQRDSDATADHRLEFFRLPVDRVFTVAGHGTVVTGTARGGAVRVGDAVRIMPAGQVVRVRNIQVHGVTSTEAGHGQRVALNLAATDLPQVERGCTIADTRLTTATTQFDASLEVCGSAPRGLRNQQRVRVYLGTAERFGRVVLAASNTIGPSASSSCRIVVTEPLLVMRGDRYVVRDETASHTLGGGAVLHPWPPNRLRRDAASVRYLGDVSSSNPEVAVAAFVGGHHGTPVSLEAIGRFLNREPSAAWLAADTSLLRLLGGEGQPHYLTIEDFDSLARGVVRSLSEYHQRHPLEQGCDIDEVRARAAPRFEPRTFRMVIEALAADGVIVREASRLRLRGHRVSLGDAERQVASRVLAAIGVTPLSPPPLEQLPQSTGIPASALRDVLRVLEREQVVVKVGTGFYFLREAIERARREIPACADATGTITAARVRDRLGTSRKYTIPLLEYFDRTGLTIRIGEVHRLRTQVNT